MRTPVRFAKVFSWRRTARAEILRFIKDTSPDILFAGNYNSVLTASVLSRVGIPFDLVLYGGDVAMGLSTPFPFRRKALRRVISDSRWIFTISSYTASMISQLCPDSKGRLSVVGCGVPLERVVDRPDRATARLRLGFGKERILLTVCRLVPNKGVANVLRAMPLILKKHPDCRFIVVGDGMQRPALESLAAQLGIRGNVSFMGFVTEETRDFVYQAADLFVMTSEGGHGHEIEGFGITFLEANANGLAVVGSRVGGIPDAVDDGLNGLLVEQRNPVQLAVAVDSLLNDPQRCREMARNGIDRIRQHFNWAGIAAAIESRISLTDGLKAPTCRR
jgi:phosphatidylinositol alpha-1,6-mannosyltransferase